MKFTTPLQLVPTARVSGAVTFHLPLCLRGLDLDKLSFTFTIFIVKDVRFLHIHAGVALCSSTHMVLRSNANLRTLQGVSATGGTHIRNTVCIEGYCIVLW